MKDYLLGLDLSVYHTLNDFCGWSPFLDRLAVQGASLGGALFMGIVGALWFRRISSAGSNTKQRDDGGLVGGDAVEIADKENLTPRRSLRLYAASSADHQFNQSCSDLAQPY